jgi:hypothetical protein
MAPGDGGVVGRFLQRNVADPVGEWIARKQQEAIDAGLWTGGEVWQGGRPTRAGVMDALHASAEGVAMGTTSSGGGPPGFTAYHGSPHKFPPTARNPLGEFDPAKIGTGEGAQAYGVGAAYLAEREGIAREGYRDKLSKGPVTDPASGRVYQSNDPYYEDAVKMFGSPGHMYEVRVHADPEKFLHWDKPLSEQHPDVQKFFRDQGFSDLRMRNPGSTAYGALSLDKNMKMTRAADVSAALQKAGIPGIRYLDQGSRSAGEGSHNAVVFSPEVMEIIRRYGIAGLMAGAGTTGALSNGGDVQ